MGDSCPGCPRCGLAMVQFGEVVDGWVTWLCPMDDETTKTRGAPGEPKEETHD